MAVETDRASLCTEEQLALEQVVRQLEHSMRKLMGRSHQDGRDVQLAQSFDDQALSVRGYRNRLEAPVRTISARRQSEGSSTPIRLAAASPSRSRRAS